MLKEKGKRWRGSSSKKERKCIWGERKLDRDKGERKKDVGSVKRSNVRGK